MSSRELNVMEGGRLIVVITLVLFLLMGPSSMNIPSCE